MSLDKVNEAVEFELEEIETLFQMYKKGLFDLERIPNMVEMTAFASVLHSFYNGIENILLIIAKNIDKKKPSDINWHKSLLLQMIKENESRKPVLSEEMKDELTKYLIFRHFYRHSYSFHLEWEEMEKLVKQIHQVWRKFKTEILSFLSNMETDE